MRGAEAFDGLGPTALAHLIGQLPRRGYMNTLTTRPYAGEIDLPAVVELLNSCDAADQLDDNYAIDDLRLEFADPRLDPANDLRLWEDADGALIGFGQVWLEPDADPVEGSLYWRVATAARGSGVEDEIMAWAGERVRQVACANGRAAWLRCSTRAEFAYGHALPQRHGMRIDRHFFQMHRPLDQPIEPVALPAGFRLRHVADAADVAAWVAAFNQSFIDHWNFHPITLESHMHWMQHPSYRPAHDLIAVAEDGTIAAFSFCIIDAEENARNQRNYGSIAMLGTRRGYRRRGLGRAMLLAGLQRLKADGAAVAKLNVDTENPTGALRLYESVGFHVAHSWQSYSKELHTV